MEQASETSSVIVLKSNHALGVYIRDYVRNGFLSSTKKISISGKDVK